MKEKEVNKRVAKKPTSKEASVQAYLEVAEIRDDVITMKDGSLRAVIMTSSLNFDLKSPTEQEAIIVSYQNFLNSLDFPLQIVVRSKRLDLDQYLFQLDEAQKKEPSEFIKAQIEQYTSFIRSLLDVTNIMDKKFYLVVPFYASGLQTGVQKMGLFQKIANSINPTLQQKKKEEEFQTHKTQLLERMTLIMQGLNNLGLRAAQLSTDNLIELFYEIYNLDTAQREKIRDVDILTTNVVE